LSDTHQAQWHREIYLLLIKRESRDVFKYMDHPFPTVIGHLKRKFFNVFLSRDTQ